MNTVNSGVVNIVNLWYNDSRSDKVYNVKLELADPNEQSWTVDFEYGRRNSNLRKDTKTKKPTSFQKANKIYNELIQSKINKGYEYMATQEHLQSKVSEMLLNLIDVYYKKDWITNNELEKLQGMLRSQDWESQRLAEKIINTKIIK